MTAVGQHPRGHDRYFGKDSYTGYGNSRVAELLEEAATTVSPEEQDRLYRELVPIFQRELPALFLYPGVQTTVAHRRVRGLRNQVRVDPVSHMEELWLARER
ncbi:MAG: hypothetical protein Q8Q85_01410 [Gemmatimonadales bacterium]|nr:hypothetical protein [Gemmatimonadales bacterium]